MEKIYQVSDKIYKTNSGSEYVILDVEGKIATIRFLLTNSVKKIQTSNIPSGKIKDVYEPSYYGVGYLGEYKKNRPEYWSSANQLWRNMIKRCHSEVDPKGYLKYGTKIETRWYCFEWFLSDIKALPGFNNWKNKENYQLDKDSLIKDSNIYSRETCSFIPEALNKSLGKSGKRLVNGEWLTPTP